MKTLRLVIALAALSAAAAIGAAERTLKISSYSSINIAAGVEVKLRVAPGQPYVKISGPQKNLDNVEVSISRGCLSVMPKSNKGGFSFFRNLIKGVTVTVFGPAPNSIDASAGAEFECRDVMNLNTGRLSVECSSGAEVELHGVVCGNLSAECSSGADIEIKNINAKSVKADCSSGGEIDLSGNTERAKLDASSGGKIDAQKLAASSSDIDRSSGGRVKLGRR